MKIRLGFVSNSSSSSFCIAKSHMTAKQIEEFNLIIAQASDEEDETRIGKGKLYFMGELSQHNTSVFEWLKENNLDEFAETYC